MIILLQLVNLVYYALVILIFARFVFSWVRVDPYHPTWGPLARFVYQATEPLLEPIRRVLPPQGGLDFSPMVLLFGIYILRIILFSLL
ncbi:MAG: YggT family protein [Chloroflexi bacterium]|nr:YggT family protein [Chloroflexota bacterium]